MSDCRPVLLWLESTKEGTAPRFHLDGTLERLRWLGIRDDDTHVLQYAGDGGRAVRLATGILRGLVAAAGSRPLIARWHPLLAPVVAVRRVRGGALILLVQGTLEDAIAANAYLGRFETAVARSTTRMFRASSGLAAPHPQIAEWVDEQGSLEPGTCVIMPNGIPAHDRAGESAVAELPRRYVVFVGFLAPWQGIRTLRAALDEDDWPSGVSLVVVGDGPEAEYLDSHPHPRLMTTGHLPPSQARPVLRGALCTVSPKLSSHSSRGWSPFKLLEAAAEGVPAVVSDVPGQTEFIRAEGSGVVVAPGDARALAEAVAHLDADADARSLMAARARASAAHYSWETHAGELGRLLGVNAENHCAVTDFESSTSGES